MRLSGYIRFSLIVLCVRAEDGEVLSSSDDASATIIDPCNEVRIELENAIKEQNSFATKLNTAQLESQQKIAEYDVANKHLKTAFDTCNNNSNQLQAATNTCNANLSQTQVRLTSCETEKHQSKEVEEIRQTLLSVQKERDTLSAENVQIVQVNQGLIADLTVKTSELEVSTASTKSLSAQIESLTINSRKESDSCASSQSNLQSRIERLEKDHSRKLQEATAKVQNLNEVAAELKQELSESTRKIYTASQFRMHVEHSRVVGIAFLGFVRNRVANLIGQDTYKLIYLQARIWYMRSVEGFNKLYQPISRSSGIYYERYARIHVESSIKVAKAYLDGPAKKLQESYGKGLGFIESYMDGVINNLSSVDPNVRELFPTTFYDRCYAFAFLSMVFYFTSEVVQYCLRIIWTALLSAFISKKGVKQASGSSSGASGKRKVSGNPAGGKNISGKQGKKEGATNKSSRS